MKTIHTLNRFIFTNFILFLDKILIFLSIKKFYIIDREYIKDNILFIICVTVLFTILSSLAFKPILKIQEIFYIFVFIISCIIPKLRLYLLNNTINSIWILLNLFIISITLAGSLYITVWLLHNIGYSKITDFYILSFHECFDYSRNILSFIITTLLGIGITKLVFNCKNFKDFFYNFGIFLLALFNLAFFAMIFFIILSGFIIPVLGLILFLFDLDLGILKMNNNESNHQSNRPIQSNPNPEPNPGPNNPDPICKPIEKEREKFDEDKVERKNWKNIFTNTKCNLERDLGEKWDNRYDKDKRKDPAEQHSCKWCVILEKIELKRGQQVAPINFSKKNIADVWGETHDLSKEQVEFLVWANNNSIEKGFSYKKLLLIYDSTKHKELNLPKYVEDGDVLYKGKTGYVHLTNNAHNLGLLHEQLTKNHLENSFHKSTKYLKIKNLLN